MSQIKECFTSRWKDGYLLEVDWSQLEIVMLQVESQDLVLEAELRDGVDLHCAMTAAVYLIPYRNIYEGYRDGDDKITTLRRKMKSARFALQYGASAKKLAVTAGMSVAEAADFIDIYYNKYSRIKEWNNFVRKEVMDSARPTGELDEEGLPVYKGQYTGPNGRRYVFTGGPKYGKVSFSPTKLQNYPIQGLASDFVKQMRTLVIRQLYGYTFDLDCYPVNTIHDSVMFDCRSLDAASEMKNIIDRVYSNAQHTLSNMVGKTRKVNVPLNYTYKLKSYWS